MTEQEQEQEQDENKRIRPREGDRGQKSTLNFFQVWNLISLWVK